MVQYPGGIKKNYLPKKKPILSTSKGFKNRGMGLESDINASNDFYNSENIALIHKRPTPINVVKVDYQRGAKITHAYFEKQSTTDYNGVFQKRYLDFEAKSTQSKTSLPISNITTHQVEHLRRVIEHGGIAFFIIGFEALSETYLLKAEDFLAFMASAKRQSLPYRWIKEKGAAIPFGMRPRLDYLKVVQQLYF